MIQAFRERLLEEMERAGMNRKTLAARLNVSFSYLSKVIRGEARFNETLLCEIARALNIPPHTLLQSYGYQRGVHEMPELKELIELMQIPIIRRGVLSRLDDLKAIHKDLILDHQKKTQESPPM